MVVPLQLVIVRVIRPVSLFLMPSRSVFCGAKNGSVRLSAKSDTSATHKIVLFIIISLSELSVYLPALTRIQEVVLMLLPGRGMHHTFRDLAARLELRNFYRMK